MLQSCLVFCRVLISAHELFLLLGQVMAVAVQPEMEAPPKRKPTMKQRRVVVTGMGVETPLGHDPDVFYTNLLEGASGITEIEAFDCSHYPTVRPFEFFFFQ